MGEADWREHFGAAWELLAQARAAHDPAGILNPGPGIFGKPRSQRRAPVQATLGDLVRLRLGALGRALDLDEEATALTELFGSLQQPWAQRPAGGAPTWPSDITDDGTPFELSVAFAPRRPELRLLLEPQQLPATPQSSFQAGLEVNERLARTYAADLTRFDLIAPLFAPEADRHARFSLWHAIVMTGCQPLVKVYLNPEVHGRSRAIHLVHDALQRLGLANAWNCLATLLTGPTRVPYLSLDLAPGKDARVKVYLAHPGRPAATIDAMASAARNHRRGDFVRWVQAMGVRDDRPAERPTLTCFSFTDSRAEPEVTLHLPVRCHAANDAAALAVGQLLAPDCARTLEAAVRAVAARPLEARTGLITYYSLRRSGESVRLTAYLAPEAYAVRQDT
jgi:DMATS type aromatic prenyltransferase